MRLQITRIIGSIHALRPILGEIEWRAAGFEELGKLGWIVDTALSLTSETERFHHLGLFRAWVFWFDVSRINEEENHLGKALVGHFYLMILTVAPIFPARYAIFLQRVCLEHIRNLRQSVGNDFKNSLGLNLVDATLSRFEEVDGEERGAKGSGKQSAK